MQNQNPDADARLASLAARLMGLAMRNALTCSSQDAVERASALHYAGKLYSRMVITAPHGGGAVRVELTLCDPATDEPAVQMFIGEAQEEIEPCH